MGAAPARVKINVADGIPQLYRDQSRAEIIWTPDDIKSFHKAAKDQPQTQDILDLATVTGLRRADLAALTLDEVGEHAIIRTAQKKSKGRRRRAAIPITDAARAVIARLRTRHKAEGVNTLLVNSYGRPWTKESLGAAFHEIRDAADIKQPGNAELGIEPRKKHLHDCRGTFVTLLCRAGLTDREIADIVAWSPENVATIRKTYVDDAAVVVALAERISEAAVKRAVK